VKLTLNILIGLVVALLAGCETTGTGEATTPAGPTEQVITGSVQRVRSAAIKIMSERGYEVNPVGDDTLVCDRSADLGSSAKYTFLYGKESWRRVRIRMSPADTAVRVTAEPFLVINRASQFEKEEADQSESARKVMGEILARIQSESQTNPDGG
jgi:hypothetical protein